MSAATLPTELECLSARLVNAAANAVAGAQGLPYLLASAANWQPDHKTPDVVTEMLYDARAMQFDAMRLAALVQAQDAALRHIYSLTMDLVDSCRLARSTMIAPGMPEVAPSAGAVVVALALADLVEDGLADMQQHIAAQFPGEEIPGD